MLRAVSISGGRIAHLNKQRLFVPLACQARDMSTYASRRIGRVGERFWSNDANEDGQPITVAYGDGVGPEIMDATLRVLKASGARLRLEEIEIGEKMYLGGFSSGISPEAWDTLRRNKVFLKAPITTPIGGGYKSLNVSIRKTLGLYANVRPCVALDPFVKTRHPDMDLVIVRENEEDTYAGIEHRQTQDVYQCLKLISTPGCERIARYAFEYARTHGRKKVTCFVKDNIMKMTDGLFFKVFDAIGKMEYPDIQRERMIIDIGAAILADRPETFDVLVMPNLYGDIMSDIAAQLTGSVGLGGSANIGSDCSMFEAIHGSAPDIAGMDVANPSGLMLAAVQMLVHIGQPEAARRVYNAWAVTLEDGIHTRDIFDDSRANHPSVECVGTEAFATAVIERLDRTPQTLPPAKYEAMPTDSIMGKRVDSLPLVSQEIKSSGSYKQLKQWHPKKEIKYLHGVDMFFEWSGPVGDLVAALQEATADIPDLELRLITNRGVKVWPNGFPETFCTRHWRCRFRSTRPLDATEATEKHQTEGLNPTDLNTVVRAVTAVERHGLDLIKMENLYVFDGKPGFSLGQGE